MKKIKLMSLLMSAVMATGILTACGKTETADKTGDDAPKTEDAKAEDDGEKTETEATEGEQENTEGGQKKVLYLVNGSLGDKGFYDNAAAGFYRLRDELGYDVKIIEMGRDETAYESYYLDESEKDWDLIVSGTWSVKELAEDIATQFPDQKYLFFDGEVDFGKVTDGNMMGITYQSNETAYMAGALGALMLETDDPKVDGTKQTLGFVGSMDSPNINDFLVGYIEGIKYVNPEIKLLSSYVGSFEDVPTCLEMTTQLYNQGAQIVYAPASQSILGSVQASSDKDKYFIACDNDIWGMMSESDPEMVRNVLSSSMKHIGDSIFNAVKGYFDGEYEMGNNYVLGIKDGAVGLAKNDNYVKLVPEDVKAKLDEISGKIASGEIVVSSAFGMETEAVAKLRDDMKP